MPPELVALGDHLQAAVERSLARRRERRTTFLNAVASVTVALPLALAVLSADLTPQIKPSVGAGGARSTLAWTPGFPLAVAHIPDEVVIPAVSHVVCLDARDCRAPVPFYLETPLGKV